MPPYKGIKSLFFKYLYKYETFTFLPKYAWESIIEHMNDGIVIIDHNSIIQYANPHMLKLTGYSHEELLYKNIISFISDDENRTLLRQHISSRKEGTSAKYVLALKKKGGHVFTCQISATPYFDKKNRIIGSVGIVEDIHEKTHLTKALAAKINELNLFIYRTYHELKGPLASIEGLCNLAMTESKRKDLQNYIQMIHQGTLKLDHALCDLQRVNLLSYSKIEFNRVNIHHEIESLKEMMKTLTNFSKITFLTKIHLKEDLITDKTVLLTILKNLVTNAINYADPRKNNSFVTISVSQKGSEVVFVVEDNGIGISEQHQHKVWDMFFRANDSVDGTGLGLYIAKRGAERLKGSISLTSKLGLGSLFKLVLTSSLLSPIDVEASCKPSPAELFNEQNS